MLKNKVTKKASVDTVVPKKQYLSTSEALVIAKSKGFLITRVTMTESWCKKYALGKRVGGRWYILESHLMEFLEGEKHDVKKEKNKNEKLIPEIRENETRYDKAVRKKKEMNEEGS